MLKIVKNRLQSSMGQPRLCALMLTGVKRELLSSVDFEAVIDAFATSPLKNYLLFKSAASNGKISLVHKIYF